MADLLVDGEKQRNLARKPDRAFRDPSGQRQQHAGAELVVQEAAADEAALGHTGAGVQADHVARGNAQPFDVLAGGDLLIQKNLQRGIVALFIVQLAVDVLGGVAQLHYAGIAAAVAGDDGDVLGFHSLQGWSTQAGEGQPPVRLDGADHQPQRVHMRGQDNGTPFSAKRAHHAAFAEHARREAKAPQRFHEGVAYLAGIARGAGDGQEAKGLIKGITDVERHGTFPPKHGFFL